MAAKPTELKITASGGDILKMLKKFNFRPPLNKMIYINKLYNVKNILDLAVPINEGPWSPKKKRGRPFGYKVTEETKKKLSDINKGKVMSPESRKRLSDIHKGRSRSPEVVSRMSEWLTGKATISIDSKQQIRMNTPHRNTIKCIETGMYFASSREASIWMVKDVSCATQIRVSIIRDITYKRLKFIKVDKESITEDQMWRSIDNPGWRGYINIRESVKKFKRGK